MFLYCSLLKKKQNLKFMDISCQIYDRTLKIRKRADQQGPAGLEVQWQSPWVSCVLHLRSGLEGAGKYKTNKQANKKQGIDPKKKKVPSKVHFLYPKDQRVGGLT